MRMQMRSLTELYLSHSYFIASNKRGVKIPPLLSEQEAKSEV